MAANAELTLRDTNGNQTKKNLPNLNPSYVPIYGSSIDTLQAAKINQAVQSLNSLTTNSLLSTKVVVTTDISEYEEA